MLLFVLSFTAALALFALLVWGNMRFAGENAGGEDFLMRWDNAREFVRNGVSPYSDQAAESAEVLIYGHTAQTDAERMVASYPLYALIVYLPMTLVEDPIVARAIWMAVLEVAVLAAAILSVYLSGWRVKPLVLLIFLFFSVFWYHGFRPIVTGEITPLVTLLVVSALLAVKNEQSWRVYSLGWLCSARRWYWCCWSSCYSGAFSMVGYRFSCMLSVLLLCCAVWAFY